jgi:hypothetical protein
MVQALPAAYEGEDVPITVHFTDDTGADVNEDSTSSTTPTGPTITVTAPDSTPVVDGVVMTNNSTGHYEHVWDTAGDTTGTGTYQVEVSGEFSSETKIAKATITIE